MGYSHYWNRPKVLGTPKQFQLLADDCAKIFAYCENELGIKLANGDADLGSLPEATNTDIWFNGSDEQPIGNWTTYEEINIPWPSKTASILEASEPTAGTWFAGTIVTKRIAPVDNLSSVASGSFESVYINREIESGNFQLDRMKDKSLYFQCCKTAYRPYDLTVTAVLIALKHHFPDCENQATVTIKTGLMAAFYVLICLATGCRPK